MSKKIRVALLWTSMVMALIASSGIASAAQSWS
jgi:hypothetical protein